MRGGQTRNSRFWKRILGVYVLKLGPWKGELAWGPRLTEARHVFVELEHRVTRDQRRGHWPQGTGPPDSGWRGGHGGPAREKGEEEQRGYKLTPAARFHVGLQQRLRAWTWALRRIMWPSLPVTMSQQFWTRMLALIGLSEVMWSQPATGTPCKIIIAKGTASRNQR